MVRSVPGTGVGLGTGVGAGIVIEKAFQEGGRELRESGFRVESLARIGAMSQKDGIQFVE